MDLNLGLGGKYLVYAGYFQLLSVQGHFEAIRCISYFSYFQQPHSQKRLVVE